MKRALAIVILAVIGFAVCPPALAQLEQRSQTNMHGRQRAQSEPQLRAQYVGPIYPQRDTWYEFLLKQFNPDGFDYGAWMEERRQAFLDASVRNPYFKYSLGTTTALLILAVLYASSLMDYLFRWIELKFLKNEQGELFGSLLASSASVQPAIGKGAVEALGEFVQLGDAPACNVCGSLMVRSGSCYRCVTCGSTSGCS